MFQMILMNNNLYAYLCLIVVALVTFSLRCVGSLLFSNRDMPKALRYMGSVLPFAIMPMLIIYCIKGTAWLEWRSVLPVFAGIVLTALIHLWKRNIFLSLIIGTTIYMVLIRVL